MKALPAALLPVFLLLIPEAAAAQDGAPLSDDSDECLSCHEILHPGIVADWQTSRHAQTTPAEALGKPAIERRFSAAEAPAGSGDVAVGCYECHGRNTENHADAFDHYGFEINVVVSPQDCATCHPVEEQEYAGSKKANALPILTENPVYHALVNTVTSVHGFSQGRPVPEGSSEETKNETCYACHGSKVEVTGTRTAEFLGEEIELPVLSNWPNQGVGRLNPDGSYGACTACHPRHGFSIEVARKPFTCAQCHLAPDVPAWEVYHESKHGNLFESQGEDYEWEAVPWKVGTDFRAPTCATCHNALIATPDGEEVVPRSHDFGARLWVRIFGLPYTHPQPISGETWKIRNADGQPLPTTFGGRPASEYLIDAAEQERRLGVMKRVCNLCHSSSWADGHFRQLDRTIAETDRMVLAATRLMQQGWDAGVADPANPFDEAVERTWMKQWLFYANSVRYGVAMGGPDYASFKHGWWDLTENLAELEDKIEVHRKLQAAGSRPDAPPGPHEPKSD